MRSNAISYDIKNEAFLDHLDVVARVNRSTSSKYMRIDSRYLIDTIADHLDSKGFEYNVEVIGGASDRSSKHILKFQLLNAGTRDDGIPQLLVFNSYNGECSMQIQAGFFRFVCANGLVMGTGEECFRVRHTTKFNSRNFWQVDMLQQVEAAIADILNKETRIAQLEATPVDWTEQSKIIMGLAVPDAVKINALHKRHPDNKQYIREEDRADNLWNVLNTVNEEFRKTSRSELAEIQKNTDLITEFVRLAA